jgi:phage terminase large subunit-like protein
VAGRACYAGLDLASTTDLAALVLLFPDVDGSYDILHWAWAPERACRERERTNKTRYDAWVRQGLIAQTPGDVVDYDRIRVKILELGELYDIRDIDRWNSTQLATQLQGDGFEVVGFGQGFASMTAPTKELESLMLSGKLRHGGNPVLRWMAGNVTVETDAAGNLKPSKKKSTEKIDGIVALIMALGRAMVRPELDSVYDGQGVDLL